MPKRRSRAKTTFEHGAFGRAGRLTLLLLTGLAFWSGCPQPEATPEASPAPKRAGKPAIQVSTTVTGPIQPIPLELELDEARVALGRQLFHEKGLSSDGSISCASCHNLQLAGTDRKRVSSGVGGAVGEVVGELGAQSQLATVAEYEEGFSLVIDPTKIQDVGKKRALLEKALSMLDELD